MISGCCLNNNFAFGGQLTYSLWPSKWLIFESSTLSFVLELMRGQLHQMLSSLDLLLHLMRRLTGPYKFCLTTPILLASHIISHQPKKTTGASPESQGAGEGTVKLYCKGVGTGTAEAFKKSAIENYFLLSNARPVGDSWNCFWKPCDI